MSDVTRLIIRPVKFLNGLDHLEHKQYYLLDIFFFESVRHVNLSVVHSGYFDLTIPVIIGGRPYFIRSVTLPTVYLKRILKA